MRPRRACCARTIEPAEAAWVEKHELGRLALAQPRQPKVHERGDDGEVAAQACEREPRDLAQPAQQPCHAEQQPQHEDDRDAWHGRQQHEHSHSHHVKVRRHDAKLRRDQGACARERKSGAHDGRGHHLVRVEYQPALLVAAAIATHEGGRAHVLGRWPLALALMQAHSAGDQQSNRDHVDEREEGQHD